MIIQCKDNDERNTKMLIAKQMIINGYTHVRRNAKGELTFFKPRISRPEPNAVLASELRYVISNARQAA